MSQPTLVPYLGVRDADRAIDFYRRAFSATEVGPRLTGPDGKVIHTELRIGSATFMLADEFPEWGNLSPLSLGGTPVRLAVEVHDVDRFVEQAVAAGAQIEVPVDNQFYGYCSGRISDPFGHQWIVSTKVEDISAEEMQRRADAMFAG